MMVSVEFEDNRYAVVNRWVGTPLYMPLMELCYAVRMIRTQIQLTEEQAEALRARAAAEGRSMEEVVHEGIDLLLRCSKTMDRQAIKNRSLKAIGRFRSGVSDLSSEHDRYLGEAFPD